MANDVGNGAAQGVGPDAETLRQYQELWFALARRNWMSVVLVPADPGGSAASVGKSLADIGTRLSEIPVTAIAVSSMGYDSAFALADLQQHIDRTLRHRGPDLDGTIDVTGRVVNGSGRPPPGPPPEPGSTDALAIAPTARLVIAIPAIISEPLGLAAAQSADAIVLTVEMGRTRLADARRTIELIGRERIAGCFVVR